MKKYIYLFVAMMAFASCGDDETVPPGTETGNQDGDSTQSSDIHLKVDADGTTNTGAKFSTIDATNFYIDYIKYTIVNGHLKVSDYDKNAPAQYFVHPKLISSLTYNGSTFDVFTIGGGAFRNCSTMKAIDIPSNITSIEDYSFSGCTNLTSIIIPNNVTSIGPNAFEGCTNLTSIIIPNNVTSIGPNAFEGCTNLTSIIIPNNVTSIGPNAFEGCTALTSVTFPNCVTRIGYEAFQGCSILKNVNIFNLTAWCNVIFESAASNPTYYARKLSLNGEEIKDLIIPEGVNSISGYAFYYCSGITSITIPNSVTRIGNSAFEGCSGLSSVEIPNSIETIGIKAFADCSRMDSIIIPSSVLGIGSSAFWGCIGLKNVTCLAKNPPSMDYSSYPSFEVRDTLHILPGYKDAYSKADGWNRFKTILEDAVEQ